MKRKIPGILMSILMVITMIPSLTFAAGLPFKDVSTSAWYYNDVKSAYETGLINGMTATTFEPELKMTYAQAVKLAACMNQKYSTGSVTLANGSPNWWDSYVEYAKSHNIINKDYDWNANATRAGYVEIFAKALPDEALKEKNSIANGYIPDVGVTHPQGTAIYRLYRAGILTGMDEKGTFEPDSNIRRSEVSAILTRMMNEDARRELTLGPVTKKVIFNSNGGSAVETQQVAQYEKVVKPADPTREGYGFIGWYMDSELTTAFDFDLLIAEDQILYAKWKKTETTVRQDGDRFEDVIIIEGMEETVRYEHVRNETVGFELDYDYERFKRHNESNGERFVLRYDDPENPQNYFEVTYSAADADTVSESVSKALSNDYDIIKDPFTLDRAGSCIRINASEAKGGKGTPDWLQVVYIIPAADGCRVVRAHYSFESADGFGRRLSYIMNTFSVIASQGERRISNEQALDAIERYCYSSNPDLEDIVNSGKYTVMWGITSMDDSQIVVLYRSYTGAQIRYYIDPVSGDTYVTESVSGITPEEKRTEETLNVWNYITA